MSAERSILKNSIRKIKAWQRGDLLHSRQVSKPYDLLGSDYGGWPVLKGSLNSDSIVYSFGVGDDISFDLALISIYNCIVNAFDPTPRCKDWISRQGLPGKFRFHGVGLLDRSTSIRFSAPTNEKFMSYTVGERPDAPDVVELPVKSLDEIMKDLGNTKVDFLKMDIEGAEYEVIADLVLKSILPNQLCIEFHHSLFGYSAVDTKESVDILCSSGYRIFYVSATGREYGFVLENE